MANLEPEKLNTGLTHNLELKVNCHYVICFRIVNLGRTELLQIESKEIFFFFCWCDLNMSLCEMTEPVYVSNI